MIRLVVVAPTVNVREPAGDDVALVVRADLPRESLRKALQEEVLPEYARVFRQHAPGSDPEGGALSAWVEGLTERLQAAVEQTMAHVFAEPPSAEEGNAEA